MLQSRSQAQNRRICGQPVSPRPGLRGVRSGPQCPATSDGFRLPGTRRAKSVQKWHPSICSSCLSLPRWTRLAAEKASRNQADPLAAVAQDRLSLLRSPPPGRPRARAPDSLSRGRDGFLGWVCSLFNRTLTRPGPPRPSYSRVFAGVGARPTA